MLDVIFQIVFFLFPATENEINALIKNLKLTKTNINKMPVKIFSSISPLLLYPLTKLINKSFQEGVFPTALKLARITPIYKNGEKTDPYNYRPISSLPYLSKIFENCMKNRIISFFDKHNLFSRQQFGFLKNKSTQDALLELIDKIYDSLNEKKYHLNILIDLRKAFDVVNHEILLRKLFLYRFNGTPLNWIKSYLKDRQRYVSVGDKASNSKIFNIGVPQGSILGPILFLIYINDLPNVSKFLHSTLYADDTTFSYSNKNYHQLTNIMNNELKIVERWTHANRLTINTDKTEIICFSNRPKQLNPGQIQLSGQSLNFSTSCKFLGVFIDYNLNFSQHITYILNKTSKNCGIFYKIKDSMSRVARMSYYYAMIYPYLSYNIVIWGAASDVHLNPLFLIQKRMVRNILNAGFLEHSEPLFKSLKILKLKDIYLIHILISTHKSILNKKIQNPAHCQH